MQEKAKVPNAQKLPNGSLLYALTLAVCIYTFIIFSPAISQLLSGLNGSSVVLMLGPRACVLPIFHYQRSPSESFRGTVFELGADHSIS